jgi:flagellar hook-associated protein 1 FlgK
VSTFSGLNTAYAGLTAARQGLNVVGQNISNVNTEGYTRQRVSTSSNGPVASTGLFTGGARVGQGVSVDGIARLGDLQLDARVRSSSAVAGYSAVRANALSSLETSLREPGENGISAQLQEFWAGWQDLSNRPDDPAAAAVLLEEATALVSKISTGYGEIQNQWAQLRGSVDTMADELNGAAAQVADLNGQIRSILAAGGNVNELLDKRSTLTTTIAALTGGTVREQADGTVDVVLGGNAIVSGDSFRAVQVTGGEKMNDGRAVHLEWAHRPGTPLALDGGEIAGALTVLAPAGGGSGGALAEAAASYNEFAQDLTTRVNAIYRGTGGGDFFGAGVQDAALNLKVMATAGSLRAGSPDLGPLDGSVADQISQLGVVADGPGSKWASFVTDIGVATKTELQQAALADLATSSAVAMQLSNSSVDLDEENVNLLAYQHAYQGAARVMTAIDEMLDTLINRTGLVGR